MVSLSTVTNALQSDRVPVFMGVNRLYLKKGIQSSERNLDIPSDVVKEQGNRLNRGTWINSANVTLSLTDLTVDMDIEQMLAEDWTTTVGTITHVKTAGASGLWSQSAKVSGGITIFVAGPTDNINSLVISYHSGASGCIRVGEGAKVVSTVASSVITVSAARVTNFSVGDTVLMQKNNKAVNKTTASITKISGTAITLATTFTASGYATSGFIFVNDSYPISSAKWYKGVPNTSVRGVEVYCYASTTVAIVSAAGKAAVGYILLSATGSTLATRVDSDGFRDIELDTLMLYNDANGDLLFTRYIQDAGITSLTYNGTADGMAQQNYEFLATRGIDFAGYVLRKSFIVDTGLLAGNAIDLDKLSGVVFLGSEVPVAITQSTSLNMNTYDQYFLKVTSMSPTGTKVTWTCVSGTPANKQYAYNASTKTITFGSGTTAAPVAGQRIELTYLCAAANVHADDVYKYDATAFDHQGQPDAVTGQYQPVTINNSNFTNRIDGLESCTMTVTFSREVQPSQGIIAPKVKTSMVGTVTGSFRTREGYIKTMNVIYQSGATGGFTDIAANTQMDINKSAKYTRDNSIPIRMRFYDPYDNTTIVKTCQIPAIQVTSIRNSNSVGDDSMFEVNFSGKDGAIYFDRY